MYSDGLVSAARVDRYGNPRGGVRAPHLDVPLVRYEAHTTPGPLCQLVGRETALPPASLVARYGDVDRYLSEFTVALDATISARFILHDDRESILQHVTTQAREAFAANDYQEDVIT